MRLFFALDIQPQDKQTISTWRKHCLNEQFKPVDVDNLHITLSFLGTITDTQKTLLINYVDQLQASSKPLTSYHLTLNQLDIFTKPKVLYLGISSTPHWLSTLTHHLKQQVMSLDIFQEQREYCPHVTLARKATKLPETMPVAIEITISSFSLYLSSSTHSGVKYTQLNTWPIFDCSNL